MKVKGLHFDQIKIFFFAVAQCRKQNERHSQITANKEILKNVA